MLPAMSEKGFMGGSMKFAVGEGDGPAEVPEGPLLPLRLLLVTSLVPTDDSNGGASAPQSPVRIDLSNPAGLFAKIRPRAVIEVPSVLDGGRPVKVEFAPQNLRSFRPDGMLAEVSILRTLLDGKLIIDRLRAAEITEDQAFGQLERAWGSSTLVTDVLGREPVARKQEAPLLPQPVAAKPQTAGSSALDSLLDLVDIPESTAPVVDDAPKNTDQIGRIISEFALGGRARAGRGKTGIPLVEEAIAAQLGAILQHPEVRRLERSYRAINFLCERAQRIPGVLLDVQGIGADGAAAAFKQALGFGRDVPFSLAVVDTDIDGTGRSFSELEAIAEAAQDAVCPAIVNGTEKLLGVGDLERLEKLDSKLNLYTAPHRAPWRSAAEKPALRWIAIAINGVLFRAPYDKQSSRVREASVRESPNDQEAFVWMAPAFAVAAVTIQSFKDTGWPGRITGARHGQVENLPVREIEDDGVPIAIPTQAFISTETQRELSRIGILALSSAPNSDAVYLHTAPTAYVKPDKKTYDIAGEELENRPPAMSLVDQLFVARLVQFARAICSKLPRETSSNEAQEILAAATWALFEKAPPSGPSLKVTVGQDSDGPVARFIVEPRRFLGVSLEEFSFEMPIG